MSIPIADRNNINSFSRILVAYASILRTFHHYPENNNCSRMRSSNSSWICARYVSIYRWYYKINEINIVGSTPMLLLISHGSYVPSRFHVIRVKYQLFDVQLFCDTAYTRSRVPRISGIAGYLSKRIYIYSTLIEILMMIWLHQREANTYAFLLGLYSKTNRYYFQDIATQENYMRILNNEISKYDLMPVAMNIAQNKIWNISDRSHQQRKYK